MFTDFNYADPSKPNYYYIFIFFSTLALAISYIIVHLLQKSKTNNENKLKNPVVGYLDKYNENEKINNYKQIYNEENIDLNKINEIEKKAKSLKYRYLTCFLCTRASIWSKAPYMYLLFNKYHGLSISEIGILYVIDAISAVIFGPITGDLADRYGRRLFCVLYCVCGMISQIMRVTGNIPLAYLSQILTGFGAGLISTTFESWINYEAEKDLKQGKKQFLEKLFKTMTVLDSINSLLITGIGAVLFSNFGLLYPIFLSIFLSGMSVILMLTLWDENKPNSRESTTQQKSFSEALAELKDKNILCVGLIESFYSAVLNIYIFSWTPLLQASTNKEINVGFIYILFVILSLLGATFYEMFVIITKTSYLKLMTSSLIFEISMFSCVYFSDSFSYRLIFLSIINGIKAFFVPINALLKSSTLPEIHRATLMNIFRIPLNIYVIFVLFVLKYINPLTLCLLCIGLISCALPPTIYLMYKIQENNSTYVTNIELNIDEDTLAFNTNYKDELLK